MPRSPILIIVPRNLSRDCCRALIKADCSQTHNFMAVSFSMSTVLRLNFFLDIATISSYPNIDDPMSA